jgi:hypothetical protein
MNMTKTNSDSLGLIYDDDASVRFASDQTGIDEGTVVAVLRSRDEYYIGYGIIPAEATDDGGTPEMVRATHPDLFPKGHMEARYVVTDLERAYIMRETGIDEAIVQAVLDADMDYMRGCGIVG